MTQNQSQIRVIDRAFSILFFMARHKEPIGVTDVARNVISQGNGISYS